MFVVGVWKWFEWLLKQSPVNHSGVAGGLIQSHQGQNIKINNSKQWNSIRSRPGLHCQIQTSQIKAHSILLND